MQRHSATPESMTVELVMGLAGDRALTPSERDRIDIYSELRGQLFFSDLLYAITHLHFAPGIAEPLWDALLVHKREMSTLLGRDVRIVVATLDYLSNIRDAIRSPTLIAEAYICEIATLSMRDGMTGLYNHSTFYDLLEQELISHRRLGSHVALILLDIDDFKSVNDRFGHQKGDHILVELSGAMSAVVREEDICCRFGGEEFAVIMPFSGSYVDALSLAERIRAAVANLRPCGAGHAGITISAGVAVSDDTTPSPRALVELADRALYNAKTNGKNQVVSATTL